MQNNTNSELQILIISSKSPFEGPGIIALDLLNAFRSQGYSCDLLLKNRETKIKDALFITRRPFFQNAWLRKLYNAFEWRFKAIIKIIANKYCALTPPYFFFYKEEKDPPVSVRKVLKKIQKPYDLVVIIFWQDLLSFKTVDAIYDKLKCQFIFSGVDYSHMTGGCHFFNDCNRYMEGCGMCKAVNSRVEDDFTRKNVLHRKSIYEKVKPIVLGNTYQKSFYDKSLLLKNYSRYELSFPIIDSELFRPLDDSSLRSKYGIDDNVSFCLFFGAFDISDKRKGFDYLIDALNIFHKQLNADEQNNTLLLVAGREVHAVKKRTSFNIKQVGLVPIEQLVELYNVADAFICPSIIDAGPTMVNQSIMCGTPVLGFEMGALLDSVKDRGTGFCAKLGDSEDLAACIKKLYDLKIHNYEHFLTMKKQCIDFGTLHYTPERSVEGIISIYNKYKISDNI